MIPEKEGVEKGEPEGQRWRRVDHVIETEIENRVCSEHVLEVRPSSGTMA